MSTSAKSNRESEICRKQGNLCYRLRNFPEAISFYGDAISHAEDDSGHLATAYSNRSSALYEISHFRESLRDVERALAVSSCPAALKPKLLNRKEKCELNLEGCKIEEEIDVLKSVKDGWKNLERFPDISTDVKINYSKEKGRYLTASRDLEPGNVIIVEQAYTSVFLPHQKDYFCQQCYSELPLDSVPCKSCADVKFCNFSCRDRAQEEFHKYECGNLERLTNVGIAHLALRVILATKPSIIADYISQSENCRGEPDQENSIDFLVSTKDEKEIFGLNFPTDTPDDVFFGRNYRTVYNMVTNREKIALTDALMYAKVSGDAVDFLDKDCHFIDAIIQEMLASEDVEKTRKIVRTGLCSLVLRHIQQLICNAHTIVQLTDGETIQTPLQGPIKSPCYYPMASAVYPSVSLMNHSCDANTFTSYIGKTAIVRVVRKIEKGEEIFNSYGHRIADGSLTRQRQEELLQQYYFRCKCSACTSDVIAKNERISKAFKCIKCSGPFCKVDVDSFECLDCGRTSDVSPGQEETCIRNFWAAIENGNVDRILDAVDTMEKMNHKFHLDSIHLRREACITLLEKGKINESVDLMIKNLECIVFHDRGQNLLFANEVLQNLACTVYFDKNLKRKDEILKHIEKSLEIFTIYFGLDCHAIKVLNDALKFAVS